LARLHGSPDTPRRPPSAHAVLAAPSAPLPMASSAGGVMASPEEAERLAAVEKKLAMTSGGNAAFKNYK